VVMSEEWPGRYTSSASSAAEAIVVARRNAVLLAHGQGWHNVYFSENTPVYFIFSMKAVYFTSFADEEA
jgi:hypothetical protein